VTSRIAVTIARRAVIAAALSLLGALGAAGVYTEARRAPDQP
jgi:hypothetical protein